MCKGLLADAYFIHRFAVTPAAKVKRSFSYPQPMQEKLNCRTAGPASTDSRPIQDLVSLYIAVKPKTLGEIFQAAGTHYREGGRMGDRQVKALRYGVTESRRNPKRRFAPIGGLSRLILLGFNIESYT
jgi:hypothetical protein